MDFIRSIISFFFSSSNTIAIILLAIAVVKLSMDNVKHNKEIASLRQQIERLRLSKEN